MRKERLTAKTLGVCLLLLNLGPVTEYTILCLEEEVTFCLALHILTGHSIYLPSDPHPIEEKVPYSKEEN